MMKIITTIVAYIGAIGWMITNNDILFKVVILALLVVLTLDELKPKDTILAEGETK